ncbi:MAG: deoxyguanosinetriphosphate triphosphohydrolase-like protein [Methanosaeta sp. PtaB.Bin039]|nr:MAG: deoxyguanosinetriphosphate triphosphohydrolase-like protein [Methanosaeta sp. PtaB.Bin039]
MSDSAFEIRDPIHGYIKMDELAKSLLDTPQVQRLRWIRQLGLASLVYPGACHSRFEHSLGTYHLAVGLADRLELAEDERLLVGAAALLHDIGHGPFSHASEVALSSYLRQAHETVFSLLQEGEIRDRLHEHGFFPGQVQELIHGQGRLGPIISGEIDADRMDYLIRDAHYTGVGYGVFDHLRLMERMSVYSGRLMVDRGGLAAAESLLVSRTLMHPTVYFHHVCRISEGMLCAALRWLIEEGISEPRSLRRMDDYQLLSLLDRSGGRAGELAGRLKSRRLYKRAVYAGPEALEPDMRKVSPGRLAEEIASAAGVDSALVIVDSPARQEVSEGRLPVLVNGGLRPLREVSPLAAALEKAQVASWRFGIYVPAEIRDRVRWAAERILNLQKSAVQYTFDDI